jgi:hypothetical protein
MENPLIKTSAAQLIQEFVSRDRRLKQRRPSGGTEAAKSLQKFIWKHSPDSIKNT